jgi:hypothetical protein
VGPVVKKVAPVIRGQVKDNRISLAEDAITDYSDAAGYATEIAKLWSDAQRKLLLIGQYLVRAKASLPHGEYEAMIRDSLPFNPQTALRLRTVAEAVDGGTLPADRVPRDYMAAYVLARLEPNERQQAEEAGLVRPDVPRREVEAFRRQIRATTTVKTDAPSADEAIRRLEARLAELDAEREVIISRLTELRDVTE